MAVWKCLRARTIDQHSCLFSAHRLQWSIFPLVLKGCYVHAGYEYTVGNSNILLLLKTHRMHIPVTRHCLHAWDSIKMMQETCRFNHAIGNRLEAAETTCTECILVHSLSTPFPWQLQMLSTVECCCATYLWLPLYIIITM